MPAKEPSTSVAELVGRIADGLGRLVTDHVTLARLELVEDAKGWGAEIARLLVMLPFVVVGYACLCGALSVALGHLIGLGWGLLAVGLANALGGGLGIWAAMGRMRRKGMMESTLKDLKQSASAIAAANEVEVARAQ